MSANENNPKIEFIKKLYCPARAVSAETGASWELILAQAAQETGWGQKVLPGTNNIFNIKSTPDWTGESKTFNVPEYSNGKKYYVDAPFRVYASIEDSVRDRVAFLKNNPRYVKAGLFDNGVKGDLEKEAQALQKAGYATDPEYAANLKTVYDGKTMQKAVAEAQKEGCGPCLPIIEVVLLNGAKIHIADTKVKVTLNSKTIELKTNQAGSFIVKPNPSGGTIELSAFNEDKKAWFSLPPIQLDAPVKSKTVTSIAPDFTIHTSTQQHEKKSTPATPNKSAAESASSEAKNASPANGVEMYTIKDGDTLSKIATQHNLAYKAIADLNHISSPYILRVGQTLKIPKSQPANQNHPDEKAVNGTPSAAATPPKKTLDDLVKEVGGTLHTIFHRAETSKPQTDVMLSTRAPWLAPAAEEAKAGVRRHKGNEAINTHITGYFSATSLGKSKTDTTPYCAAFVNWCLVKSGYKGDNNAMAASFIKWGRATKDSKPALGAVAVIKFPHTSSYHVTFVSGVKKDGRIATLGGNQGKDHGVTHSAVPASWVVAYRLPSEYPHYDDDYVLHDVKTDDSVMSASSTH